jgi:hypothetical protein
VKLVSGIKPDRIPLFTPLHCVFFSCLPKIEEGTLIKIKRMKKITWVVSIFACVHGYVLSQTIHTNSFYPGLGAYSLAHVDVFSFQSNQAALAKMKNFSAAVFSERKFMLKELSFYNAVLALPTHSGNFGLDARYFGFTDYSESQLGLAYARNLGDKIDLGLQFSYYTISIPGYGRASAINFGTGLIMRLTDKLNAGLQVQNPVGGKFGGNHREKLLSVFSAGFGYDASEKFFFSMEMEKEEDQPVNIIAGFQYKFVPYLLTRCGVSTAASSFHFGMGVLWNSVSLEAVTTVHQQLGITPGVKIIFTRNATKN